MWLPHEISNWPLSHRSCLENGVPVKCQTRHSAQAVYGNRSSGGTPLSLNLRVARSVPIAFDRKQGGSRNQSPLASIITEVNLCYAAVCFDAATSPLFCCLPFAPGAPPNPKPCSNPSKKKLPTVGRETASRCFSQALARRQAPICGRFPPTGAPR